MWVLVHAEPTLYARTASPGAAARRLVEAVHEPFAYADGVYAFVAILVVAIFGWLMELRHGPAVVLALFFGAGAAGALVAGAVYPFPVVSGANAAALALLAAWAVPDLESRARGRLSRWRSVGTGALAALLLAMPFARPEASWLAGVTGAVLGLLVGLGMHRLGRAEA